MFLLDTEKAKAVLFFGNEGIVKEMQYQEFEALLDGFVSSPDWASRTAKAVYIEINSDFAITNAVFFKVPFDKNGVVDPSWNIPLDDLAKTANKGPDLGAGPVHLACASQCPVKFFTDQLWDPDMKSRSGHFSQLKKAVKRNRLGLCFQRDEGDETGTVSKTSEAREQRLSQQLNRQYEKEVRDFMAQMLKEQRLRTLTMNNEKENALQALKQEHAARLEALNQVLEQKARELDDALHHTQQLKETIDAQASKIEYLREYFEHKLEKVQGEDAEYLEALRSHYESESKARIEAATAELNERLQMREIELMYRNEREEQMQIEVNRLREAQQEMLSNSGNQLLEKLSSKGVNFVTYQAGAGHITIPISELARFVDNPTAFTAEYCGVSEKHYEAWLVHYQTPVCLSSTATGDVCGADIPRVSKPIDFVPGESEFCHAHGKAARSDTLKLVKG